jgi:hypothetical protein
MTRELKTKSPSGRPQRTPIGRRNRLSVSNQDPNYHYRIVNDIDDRVYLMQQNGWEIVPADQARVGDSRVEASSALGSKSYISVGGGTKATVMRIPKEYYEEDQRAKQAEVDALEQTMKDDARKAADYGKLEIS